MQTNPWSRTNLNSLKTRICHISTVHLALDTRIFYRYCLSLKEDYNVSLIACHPKYETIEDVDIIPYRRYKNRVFRTLFSWLLVLPRALRTRAKIYHLHDPELLPLALILHVLGKKVIYDIHENIAEDIFDKEWIKFKNLWYGLYTAIEKPILHKATIILAEDSYLKRYATRVSDPQVIHNYCDIQFFEKYRRAHHERNPYHLFYSGILLMNRGIIEIATAIYLAKQEGIEFQFHCVAELYSQIEKALEELEFFEDIKNQLHFYGRLKLQDAYEVSKKCGIGLCIIHPMNNSIESYPTKLFEYMAVGLPSLASHFSLYKEVLEDNQCGLTVNPLDPKAICAKLMEMATDNSSLEKWSKNGVVAVKKLYNWNSEKVKIKQIYKRLVESC